MSDFCGILVVVGYIMAFVGHIMLLAAAYRLSIGWFFACFFLPFATFIIFLSHMHDTWKPMLLSYGGFMLAIIGYWAGGSALQT